MNPRRDIEIFVENCPLDKLLVWIESAIGPFSGPPSRTPESVIYNAKNVVVVITPCIDGKPSYTGIWFNPGPIEWISDAACARQVGKEIGITVRCDPGEEYPNVHPTSEIFLEISENGERLVEWKS